MITLAALGRRAAAAAWSRYAGGAEEGAVFVSAPRGGLPRLGQHPARSDDHLPAYRGRAHGCRDIGSGPGRLPRRDRAVDDRADLHRQRDRASRRHDEPVADAGAERRSPGPREPRLRAPRSVGLDQSPSPPDRAGTLRAAGRRCLEPPARTRRRRPGSRAGGPWWAGPWSTPRACSASRSTAPS